MLVQSSESTVLFKEYERVFGGIENKNGKQLAFERRAVDIMNTLKKMNAVSKKIEEEGKRDKIENFNNKYIALTVELRKIYGEIDK